MAIFGIIFSSIEAILVEEFSTKNYPNFGNDLTANFLSFRADLVELYLAAFLSKFKIVLDLI